jgi:adenylate cyclase
VTGVQTCALPILMYDPNLAEAYSSMGLSYFLWGKFEESSAACRKAMELDPEDFVVFWTLGRIHFSKGELAPAAELFRMLTRLKPDFYAGFGDLSQTCDGLGLVDEANKARAQLLEMMPMHLLRNPDDSRGRLFYAIALSRSGKREQAVAEGQKTVEGSTGDCLILYNLACLFSELGEKHKALETLRAAVQSGYQDFGWMQNDPDLDSLRGEPGFQDLKNLARHDDAKPV